MDESRHRQPDLLQSFSLCITACVVALGAAVGVGYAARELHPVSIVFLADIAATLVIYCFSRMFRNASFYDPYWSIAPLAIALFWALWESTGDTLNGRQVLLLVLVFIWGIRLTVNWAVQWRGLKHEDWRYSDLRQKTGRRFWLVELVGIELMPTMIVFLGCLSLYPVFTINHPFGALDVIGGALTAAAIVVETAADIQLSRYRRKARCPEKTMDEGLWAYSRHPNYFGEVLFWWGLYVFAMAADSGYWWTIVGPAAITALFLVISIPIMERRNLARRSDYKDYRKRTSRFIPWYPGT